MADCKNCIHIEVCKSADSCDGRVPGCRHVEPKTKHGRWEKSEYCGFACCDQCKDVYIYESWLDDGRWKHCPNCGAIMDLPRITDQTMKALEAMDRKAHGGE